MNKLDFNIQYTYIIELYIFNLYIFNFLLYNSQFNGFTRIFGQINAAL